MRLHHRLFYPHINRKGCPVWLFYLRNWLEAQQSGLSLTDTNAEKILQFFLTKSFWHLSCKILCLEAARKQRRQSRRVAADREQAIAQEQTTLFGGSGLSRSVGVPDHDGNFLGELGQHFFTRVRCNLFYLCLNIRKKWCFLYMKVKDCCVIRKFSWGSRKGCFGPILAAEQGLIWSVNGVYSLKWRLTDRYLRWGTLAGPRPGRADVDQCKSSDFLQELRISGFPRFWVSPTCFRAK